MRSIFYGTLLTVLVAWAGTVQAANDLDRKALLCVSNNNPPVYGLVYDQGKVSRHEINGYSKFIAYKIDYKLVRTVEAKFKKRKRHLEKATYGTMLIRDNSMK